MAVMVCEVTKAGAVPVSVSGCQVVFRKRQPSLTHRTVPRAHTRPSHVPTQGPWPPTAGHGTSPPAPQETLRKRPHHCGEVGRTVRGQATFHNFILIAKKVHLQAKLCGSLHLQALDIVTEWLACSGYILKSRSEMNLSGERGSRAPQSWQQAAPARASRADRTSVA